MDLDAIRQIAFDWFGGTATFAWQEKGNKFHHGQRVAKLSVFLRKQVLPENDSRDDLLTIAGWFHDCMHNQPNHGRLGAEKARELLCGEMEPHILDELCAIIEIHDRRDLREGSVWLKCQQDADLLDHFGVFAVWTHFGHSLYHHTSMKDTCEWLTTVPPSEDERFLSELHFDISKRIYREKAAFMKAFAERMRIESDGGVAGLI